MSVIRTRLWTVTQAVILFIVLLFKVDVAGAQNPDLQVNVITDKGIILSGLSVYAFTEIESYTSAKVNTGINRPGVPVDGINTNLFTAPRSSPRANRVINSGRKAILKLPVVKIMAHPESIISGESSTLKWRSKNADYVSIDQGIGDVDLKGRITVSPAETTTYTLTATGPGGTTDISVEVQVLDPPADVELGFGMDEQPGSGGLAGETIRIFNGNVIEARTDLEFVSPNRLGVTLQAFYNSRSGTSGAMGYGWSHTYEINLDRAYHHKGVRCLRIVDSTGRARYFRKGISGVFDGVYGEKSSVARVRKARGVYVWYRLDGSRCVFGSDGKLVRMIDQVGNTLQLAYDASDRLKTVTDNASSRVLTFHYNADNLIDYVEGPVTKAVSDGIWVSYRYDSNQNLQSVIYADDDNGSTASGFEYRYTDTIDIHNLTDKYNLAGHLINTWTYDKEDRAIENYSRDGRGVSIIYSSEHQVDVTDAYSREREYYLVKVDGRWRVSSISDGVGGAGNAPYSSSNIVSWIYDDDMNPIELESAGGTVIRLQDYDDRGNAGTMVMAFGTDDERAIIYTYHPHMNVLFTRTEPSVLGSGNNKETVWDYDNDGDDIPNEDPTKQLYRFIEKGYTHDSSGSVVPYKYVTSFAYNSKGQVETVDGPLTGSYDITTYGYDAASGDILFVTRPIVGVTALSDYDAAGQVELVSDFNGQSTSLDYDGRGRVITTTNFADSSVGSTEYNSAGLVSIISDEDSVNTSFEYYRDSGLLYKRFDHEMNYISYVYDKGKVIEKNYYDFSDNLTDHKILSYEDVLHDHPGLLYKELSDDGTYSEYSYDNEGNVISVTDHNGNITTYSYDYLNRLKTIIQPENITTVCTYDNHGNLETVTDAELHTTSYVYDDMGRIMSTTSPDTGTVKYVYDEAGNLEEKTDAKSIIVEYEYDILNRLTDINFPDSTQDIDFTYDEGINGIGRRTGISDLSGNMAFGYDSRGRLIDKISTVNSQTYTLSRSYSPGGRVSSVTYPTGRSITYERTTCACNVNRIYTDYNGDIVTLIDQVEYRPFGVAKALDTGAGGTVDNQFDTNGRLTVGNPGQRYETSYVYDKNGNLESIASANASWWDRDYEYDALNRLISAKGEMYDTILYTYDGVGNRLTKTENNVTDVYTYLIGTNRIEDISGTETVPYTYDANGNITGIGTDTAMNYNQDNRLSGVEIDGDVVGEYTYNGLGQRIIKTASGVTIIFHYDFDGNIIGESNDTGTFSKEYLYRGQLRLAMVDVAAGNVYNIHNDQLGTPILLTDNTNTVVWEAEYKPFGEAVVNANSSVVNNFRFPGQYFDKETGWHYNYHRYYDSGTGRYLRADPIGLSGGLNLYSYAANNPVNSFDQFGLWREDVHSGIGNKRYGTYKWARDVGLSPIESRLVAIANNNVDRYGNYAPVVGVPGRHFDTAIGTMDSREIFSELDLLDAIQLYNEGDSCESLRIIGQGLHSIQDIYAHMDWVPILPHPSWYDDVASRPDGLRATEIATKFYLLRFLRGISR